MGPADTDWKRWGLKLAAGGGRRAKKRAIVAAARKLAMLLHRLWTAWARQNDQEPELASQSVRRRDGSPD